MRLKGKAAFITGGSEGIGFAIAQAFINEGASVAIMGRSIEKLRKAQAELGSQCSIFSGDVLQIHDLQRVYNKYQEKCSKLDIVVANAGISLSTPMKTTTPTDFEKLMSANVKGVFFTIQHALPLLNEGSSIILIASLAGKQGVKSFSAYAATKAAVISLAKSFAAELVEQKIRVNSISPGVVRTKIMEGAGISEADLNSWANIIPMKRFARPEEIAAAALFLASDESSYITASDIAVDGGVSGIGIL